MAPPGDAPRRGWRAHPLLLALHGLIIAHFVVEIAYSGYVIFVVLRPEGIDGPLFSAALDLPQDLMVRRRLYAIENWIATGGLAVYLALTEIGPRLRAMRSQPPTGRE